MRRRDFVTFLGGAMTWMSAARGQEPRHVIGFLSGYSDAMPGTLAAFYQGLKETGFVQRKNLGIEFRWAGGQYDRLPSLAAELVVRNVSVICRSGRSVCVCCKGSDQNDPRCLLGRRRSG